MLSVKQNIIRTRLGVVTLALRERIGLVLAATRNPEQLGTLAQDYLAAYLLARLCVPGKVFVDVGSHIGSVISAVQTYCTNSKIIAIEAMPSKAAVLKKNYPQVDVLNYAIGDDEGEIEFYVDTRRSGYSSMVASRKGAPDVTTIKVPMQTLDSLLSEIENIDVIKIDVEGAEYRVLLGGDTIVRRHRPFIMFESVVGSESKSGDSIHSIYDWFDSRSYCILAPNRIAHNGSPFSRSAFSEAHVYPRVATNYFAIPVERRIEIRNRAREILSIKG